ncbi:hypothetical protein GTP56_13040 [Duganella sp. FT134W]|uniref:Uncharacterized protein n=1 Tax=Duganella margarita TaxID=2692170 RepID=A0A7X4H1C9_9BURK|nr:hypothetical protein [Duganella margarita]MYM73115.1 hypothetical protein [Duganella margarita]
MTASIDEFLRQHRATGSEKADGYSPDAFAKLTDQEREIVFTRLANELPWSAQWMFLVDAVRAAALLKAEEQAMRGDPYGDVFMIQENLVTHTGDLLYQKHMIEDYPNYIEKKRPLVVDAVHRTPTNADTIRFFKRVILVEANSSAVVRASRHLLDSLGLPRATEPDKKHYDALLSNLRSDDSQLKQQTLVQIGVVT